MKLKDYLNDAGQTVAAFAKQHGLEVSTVHRAYHGKVNPSWETMGAIEAATGGAVTPNDFRPDPSNDQPAEATA